MVCGMNKKTQDKREYRPKILCVDDDESVRKFTVKFLTSLGYRVEGIASAKEAIGKIQQNDYDLVITDFGMPDMNGMELAKIVKTKNPQCPVILFTGSMIPLDSEKEKVNGIDAIIHKPSTLETLRNEILKCLKQKNEREKSMKQWTRTY